MIKNWQIINRKPEIDFKIFKIREKAVCSPRTGEISNVISMDFPDWVICLAITRAKEAVMVRQYRHGIETITLELPGGLVDKEDESPLEAAKRELLEETGYASLNHRIMGECYPQPAIMSNKCFFCLAEDTKLYQKPELDQGEDIEVITIPIQKIPSMIQKQEITNGMTLLAFSFFGISRNNF